MGGHFTLFTPFANARVPEKDGIKYERVWTDINVYATRKKIVAEENGCTNFVLAFLISWNVTAFSPTRCFNLTNKYFNWPCSTYVWIIFFSFIDIRWEIHFTNNPVCNNVYLLNSRISIHHSFSLHTLLQLYSRSFHSLFQLFSLSFFKKATLVRCYSFQFFSHLTTNKFPQMYSDHSELNWYLRIGLLGFCMLRFSSIVYSTLSKNIVPGYSHLSINTLRLKS